MSRENRMWFNHYSAYTCPECGSIHMAKEGEKALDENTGHIITCSCGKQMLHTGMENTLPKVSRGRYDRKNTFKTAAGTVITIADACLQLVLDLYRGDTKGNEPKVKVGTASIDTGIVRHMIYGVVMVRNQLMHFQGKSNNVSSAVSHLDYLISLVTNEDEDFEKQLCESWRASNESRERQWWE